VIVEPRRDAMHGADEGAFAAADHAEADARRVVFLSLPLLRFLFDSLLPAGRAPPAVTFICGPK
jgi:hypothetical protein